MKKLPVFTIKDLVKAAEKGYANFEGENRVFIIFITISPEMTKLKEGDKFLYEGDVYKILMKMPPDENRPKAFQFNCLKEGKSCASQKGPF